MAKKATKKKSTKRASAGRPTRFNKSLADRLLALIKTQGSVRYAGFIAGIPDTTINTWITQGRQEGSGAKYRFSVDVQKAVDEYIEKNVSRIREYAEPQVLSKTKRIENSDGSYSSITEEIEHRGQWQAAAWELERVYPNLFGCRTNRDDSEESEDKDKKDKSTTDIAKELYDALSGGDEQGNK